MYFKFTSRNYGFKNSWCNDQLSGQNLKEGDVIYQNINKVLNFPGLFIYMERKKSRLNRKMGHITIVNKDLNKVMLGKKVKDLVKVTAKK